MSGCLQTTLLLHYTNQKFSGLIHALAKFRVNHQQNIDFGMLVGEHLTNKPMTSDIKLLIIGLCEIEKRAIDEIFTLNGGAVSLLGKQVTISSLKIVTLIIIQCL